jgi:hypothetical protein
MVATVGASGSPLVATVAASGSSVVETVGASGSPVVATVGSSGSPLGDNTSDSPVSAIKADFKFPFTSLFSFRFKIDLIKRSTTTQQLSKPTIRS